MLKMTSTIPQLMIILEHMRQGAESRINRAVFHACTMVSGLGNGIFLRMRAEAFFEPRSAAGKAITARAPPFIAIFGAAWRSIVSSRDHSPVAHNHGPDFALDAITPHGSHLCNLHEIFIPVGAGLGSGLCNDPLADSGLGLDLRSLVVDKIGRLEFSCFANPNEQSTTILPILQYRPVTGNIHHMVLVFLRHYLGIARYRDKSSSVKDIPVKPTSEEKDGHKVR